MAQVTAKPFESLMTDSSTYCSPCTSGGSPAATPDLSTAPKIRRQKLHRPKRFLYQQSRTSKTSDSALIMSDDRTSDKKKHCQIKRTNAFYLNKSMCEEGYLSFSDESRCSLSNSVGDDDTEGSCGSSLNQSRLPAKVVTKFIDRRDFLLSLKKKMVKKTPKYQGSCDMLQRRILSLRKKHCIEDASQDTILLSRVVHHSFEYKRLQYLKCWECSIPIFEGSLTVCSPETPPKHVWHPKCFNCYSCKKPLVDLVYHPYDKKQYCAEHKPLQAKICSYCRKEIKEDYTKANGRYFHPEHFQCWSCGEALSGSKYYGAGLYPMCCSCYNVNFAKSCRCCKGAIQIDVPFYYLFKKRWHATPHCFKCNACSKSLVGVHLIANKRGLYCNKQCYGDDTILAVGRSRSRAPLDQPWHATETASSNLTINEIAITAIK